MDRVVLYNARAITKNMREWLGKYYAAGWVEEVDLLDSQTYKAWFYCHVNKRKG